MSDVRFVVHGILLGDVNAEIEAVYFAVWGIYWERSLCKRVLQREIRINWPHVLTRSAPSKTVYTRLSAVQDYSHKLVTSGLGEVSALQAEAVQVGGSEDRRPPELPRIAERPKSNRRRGPAKQVPALQCGTLNGTSAALDSKTLPVKI